MNNQFRYIKHNTFNSEYESQIVFLKFYRCIKSIKAIFLMRLLTITNEIYKLS